MSYPFKIGPVNAAWKKEDFCSRIRNREPQQLLKHPDVLEYVNEHHFTGSEALNHLRLRKKSRAMGLLCQWGQMVVSIAMDMYTQQEKKEHMRHDFQEAFNKHDEYHRHLVEAHAPAHLQHYHDYLDPTFPHHERHTLRHHHAAILYEPKAIHEHTPDPTAARHRGAVKPRIAQEPKEEAKDAGIDYWPENTPKSMVLLEGWILKRSKKGGKNWQLRWAILQSNNILRYESEDGRAKGQIQMHPGIAIRHFSNAMATAEGKSLWDLHPYGFEVYCEAEQRGWYFDTRSADKQTIWIKALQYMLDYIGKQVADQNQYYAAFQRPTQSVWGRRSEYPNWQLPNTQQIPWTGWGYQSSQWSEKPWYDADLE
eukprot:gnl/MRDRNA2_/MRDRNA2_24038_c0_seq1.p1 gnl/MRDRNA2_/MRDRNA2_24038_c0~~gnl/MRDRNA2_/MRDRNA2_24038_c0_seq1.p1  ORF type:complete len:368 (-),score=56.44 gnl/MRDRNA2_/MRDRNA2_24038_c0_seq1:35-1138(-)